MRWQAAPLAILALGLAACNEDPEESGDAASGGAAIIEPTPIEGIYDVKGVTKQIGGTEERQISGTVTLRRVGDRYTTSFKLATTFPGASDPVHADVIGTGQGMIDGRTLVGTTDTQLVVSTVPGVDTQFAYIPRIVGARIVSSGRTEITPDGRATIELENLPAQGEDYRPTRTRLTGMRVGDVAASVPD